MNDETFAKACSTNVDVCMMYRFSASGEMSMAYIAEDKITDPIEKQKVKAVLAECNRRNRRPLWILKRVMDVTLSLIALVILLIPMLIIYVAIFLEDHHDPIFRQVRVGRFGKEFRMYKFRTMVPNAEELKQTLADKNEMDGPVFKIENDPRITRGGKFLRKTSLDELPQLINVLKGDMTLIGPRPPLPSEVAQYNEFQKIRLIVTPGLTCLWQVAPKRNEISFEQWVEMDIDYILHRSVWMDISIIFRTVYVMLCGEGR